MFTPWPVLHATSWASASVAGSLLHGTAGAYDDEARLCEMGALLQRSKRGVFVGLEVATHADAWEWDYRLGLGNRFDLQGGAARLQIPRIKGDGRAATMAKPAAPCFCR
jgi:hypothetical protein